uniref:JmjC domain-containing protein n=1 Tax=Eutreptiella gymnastica TaxID=73025 RepID=A0A7S1JGX9_9EUGL|mmetsp:Transcript_96383/g.166139  ORF Transcript_96383/g.166139 Transcript_96383/m.166139 type:complete len:142 (+) Transcript_96383:1-426(+)
MKEREFAYQSGKFKRCGNGTCTRDMGREVDNFSPINVAAPDLKRYPLYAKAKPINITLRAGEMLYMPSFWWHSVVSHADAEGKNIAINFWYSPHSKIFADAFLALRDAVMPYADPENVPDELRPQALVEGTTPRELLDAEP